VDYSLLIMVAVGMMKMATGDDFPSGRVPERGLDWFFVATEACGGGTSDLGLFLMVSLFIGFSALESREDGPRGEHNPPRLGLGSRRALVGYALLLALLALPRSFGGLFCSKKNHQTVSTHLENFHFCTKNNTTVVLLKTASVRVSSMQIIPNTYKIIVNMA
jgi:hypothetical protein